MSRLANLTQFLRLEGWSKSPATLRNRAAALRDFDAWLESRDGVCSQTAGPDDLAEYVAALRQRGISADHVNQHVSALRVYFRWLSETGQREDDPARGLRFVAAPPAPVAGLSGEEVRLLARFARRAQRLRFGTHRASFLAVLLLDTGLRLGEALSLRVADVDVLQGHLWVRASKTKQQRVVPVSPHLRQHVVAYLKRRERHLASRRLPDCGLLFVAEHGGPWPTGSAERGMRTVARLAGVTRRVHPHLLRHTWATQMLLNGAPLPAVMLLGGWRKWATVQRYTQMTVEQLARVQAAASPVAVEA